MEQLQFENVDTTSEQLVHVNVNGTVFMTSTDTLRQSNYFMDLINVQESNLKTMASFFVDRDDQLFRMILGYLRSNVVADSDLSTLKLLKSEAEFYQIPDLVTQINQKIDQRLHTSTESTDRKRELVYEVVSSLSELSTYIGCDQTPIYLNENGRKIYYPYMRHTGSRIPAQTLEDSGKLIGIINVHQNVWKCPRHLLVHDWPHKCGRACRRDPDWSDTNWKMEETVHYVVAYYKYT